MASIRSDQTVSSAPLAMPEKKRSDSPDDKLAKSASPSKRGLFSIFKKKKGKKDGETGEEHKSDTESDPEATPTPSSNAVPTLSSGSDPAKRHVPPQITTSPSPPQQSLSNTNSPVSASHLPYASQSPRLSSSASSQIFERNVQDPVHRPASPSGAIPAHITTEDHIPPVLEASSLMITNNQISPDSVEIVTQRAHLSASATLSSHSAPAPTSNPSTSHSPAGSTAHNSPIMRASSPPINSPYLVSSDDHPAEDLDKRRLSFISFADVVQAEHAEATSGAESPELVPTTNIVPPTTNQGIASIEGTLRGRSPSPARAQDMGRSLSSRSSVRNGPQEGLVVETMGQALRRTGSGEFREGGIAALSLS